MDEKKKCYQMLEFKRFNWVNIFKALFSAKARNALREVRHKVLCLGTVDCVTAPAGNRPGRCTLRETLPEMACRMEGC